jgi:hypothetical protein
VDESIRDHSDPLFAIQDAHDQVLLLLDDPRVPPLEAVRWLSAHVESFRAVVHPAVLRVLQDWAAVDLLHRGALCIERVLRLLERKHSGDRTAGRFDEVTLQRSLVALLVIQAGKVDWVLARLARRMPPADQRDLVAAYRARLDLAGGSEHPFARAERRQVAAARG